MIHLIRIFNSIKACAAHGQFQSSVGISLISLDEDGPLQATYGSSRWDATTDMKSFVYAVGRILHLTQALSAGGVGCVLGVGGGGVAAVFSTWINDDVGKMSAMMT